MYNNVIFFNGLLRVFEDAPWPRKSRASIHIYRQFVLDGRQLVAHPVDGIGVHRPTSARIQETERDADQPTSLRVDDGSAAEPWTGIAFDRESDAGPGFSGGPV